MRRSAPLLAGILLLAACQQTGSGSPGAGASSGASTSPAASSATANVPAVVCVGEATTYLDWLSGDFQPDVAGTITDPGSTGGLLATIKSRGYITVSTDPDYAPQSAVKPDGTYEGFDIDVATEIAKRLEVDVHWETPAWEAITAGGWQGRWDMSVGSMTITTPRKAILDFTQPYYYNPAYLAASTRSGVTQTSELPFELPSGATATTLPTDANCAEAINSGRTEFDLWISSGPTIDEAIAAGTPMVKVGEPVFTEDLSVAFDKSGPDDAAMLFAVDKIIGEMHADGTLTDFSKKWYDGADLTVAP